MKFTIEISRANEGTRRDVLHRVIIDAMSPKMVQVKARELFEVWQRRGAKSAKILNGSGEELYRWDG